VTTQAQFQQIIALGGSDVIYHRTVEDTPCPCRTPEGYRDPIWHLQHPNDPMCNEAGFLGSVNDVTISAKAFVQPIQSTRATRLRSQYMLEDFGEIESGDHLGIFPLSWSGVSFNFYDWGASAEDWIEYNSRRFTVVHANMIPDPDGGSNQHWEVGLRLISSEAL
jgi:hypothetical protein